MAKTMFTMLSGKMIASIVAGTVLLATVGIAGGVLIVQGIDAPAVKSISSSSSQSLSSSTSESSVPASSSDVSSSSAASSAASSSTSASSSSKPVSSSAASSSSKPVSSSVAPVKFDAATVGSTGAANIPGWQVINSDVVGWLKIPNTNINYPVVHKTDTLYYLERDYYKNSSKNGVIWADQDTVFGTSSQISKNSVVYGHNWTNYSATPRIGNASDVMFAQLTSFHHLSFAKITPYIHYSTASQEMTWVVFAAFYTDTGFNYIASNPDSAGMSALIAGAKARSRHIYDVDVNSSDKILTLSTCTRAYGKSDEQRFVVMARLMRAGETIKEINITANPNPVLPKL